MTKDQKADGRKRENPKSFDFSFLTFLSQKYRKTLRELVNLSVSTAGRLNSINKDKSDDRTRADLKLSSALRAHFLVLGPSGPLGGAMRGL